MSRTRLTILALSLQLVLGNVSFLQAETPPQSSLQSLFSASTEASPSPGKTPDGSQLEFSHLKAILNQLGYKITDLSEGVMEVEVVQGTWTLPTVVSLSNDGSKIWMFVRLGTLSDDPATSVNQLRSLLAANGEYGPEFFKYVEDTNLLLLYSCRDNIGLDNTKIKATVEHLAGVAVETSDIWKATATPVGKHVGQWQAAQGSKRMDFSFAANGGFSMKTSDGINLTGNYTILDSKLLLETGSEKTELAMEWNDANHFSLSLNGKILTFERI